MENQIIKKVTQIQEDIEYIDEIIEKPVPKEVIVERRVEQIQQQKVEKEVFYERIIEEEVEQVVEKKVPI